jgi:antibiotic biosynthesis monooxygenase (ABM) superfamily enzyme
VELRVSRASAVVVQRVPPGLADWFMEWQRGISAAAEASPGYKGTDVFPPAEGQPDEWVVVLHFEDDRSLRRWLDSPVRAQWVDRLRARAGAFELKALPGGLGGWFAGLARGPAAAPPSWKMVLTVLLGLYPTVMLLSLFPGRYTQPLGLAVSMLIGNALSVCILQWAVMPVLNKVFAPWLKANTDEQRGLSIAGPFLIGFLLAGLAFLFYLVTG